AEGESVISNPLDAEDTRLTAQALQQLGVDIDWQGDTIRVKPPRERWAQPDGAIMLGNSGTSTRLLLAIAATGKGNFVFDGSPRLRERPIGPVMEALGALGVGCRWLGAPGYPPVEVVGEGLSGGETWVDASQSSQFLSALLIAAPVAGRETVIRWKEPVASFPYVELTLSMIEEAGIRFERSGSDRIVVPAPQSYPPLRYTVEGDCSSASYFWAAAALTGGSVYTHPVAPRTSQGDCRLIEVMDRMGCTVRREGEGIRIVGAPRLKAVDIDMNRMPDTVPTIAVLAAFAEGETRIRNVAHLRVKESDRLSVVATELAKFGVPVRELEDGLIIEGGKAGRPSGPIEAHDDHRIAMAFSLVGLRIEGVEIHGAECVAKSFPTYWDVFEGLV
ncbi:MAG: 3-phosphoshikimate 1-carboxyvinyltransferase, partial [Acidobacteriota bacterium]